MIIIKRTGIFLLPFILFAGISFGQQVKYTNGADSWNADSLGNHRAVVTCHGAGKLVRVIIEWRRRDNNPQGKKIIVQDAKTGKQIENVSTGNINREYGDIYFEAVSGPGKYYVYYMPYRNEGRSNYPRGVYLQATATASPQWLQTIHQPAFKPNAVCNEIQSINAFNSFYPMEVIATAKETDAIKKQFAGDPFIIFPEDHMHPVRMKKDLPQRWIIKGATTNFTGVAGQGENYAFQLGVYALQDLQDVSVSFSDFKNATGNVIDAKNISCINTDGTGYDNMPLKNKINILAGTVQSLWCSMQIPLQAVAGLYKGTASVKSAGAKENKISL
ncbi:MAG: glycoside hydrolase domain-containing protein, partial [Chitinophagaceae bacterium]